MSTYKTVSFLGTSISNGYFDEDGSGGWVARLFKKLNQDKPGGYYLCNLARSGDRSFDYWHRLCGEAIQRQSDILMIEVSCNDATRFHSPDNPQSVSTETQHGLWINILETAVKNVDSVYIFSAFPTAQDKLPFPGTNDWPTYYQPEDIAAINTLVQTLCVERDIAFIDLFKNLNTPTFLDHVPDGIHPNSAGHEFAADIAYQKLKALGF